MLNVASDSCDTPRDIQTVIVSPPLVGWVENVSNTFSFECSEEHFHDGVIPTVPFSAHAHCHFSLLQPVTIGVTSILGVTIAMVG